MKTPMRMPAEWETQACVQIAWPHADTDWLPYLNEAYACYRNLAREIAAREPLVIVTPEPDEVQRQLNLIDGMRLENVSILKCQTNDTWARDHAFVSTIDADGSLNLNDFCFNGWGQKFASNHDNLISANIADRLKPILGERNIVVNNFRRIVLEGGGVESDGKGTILTTTSCLLAPNRNEYEGKAEAEDMLRQTLGAKRVLWLDHGYLDGDDTDGHIDTLARLCPDDTIVYVQCQDATDEHFAELNAMEQELRALRTADGNSYRLLPLPMADAVYFKVEGEEEERLPATYANFLIMNSAVLVPTYGQPDNDRRAISVLASAFPDREIIGIDCQVLIRQHGSLHCVTMQYPS